MCDRLFSALSLGFVLVSCACGLLSFVGDSFCIAAVGPLLTVIRITHRENGPLRPTRPCRANHMCASPPILPVVLFQPPHRPALSSRAPVGPTLTALLTHVIICYQRHNSATCPCGAAWWENLSPWSGFSRDREVRRLSWRHLRGEATATAPTPTPTPIASRKR